MGLPLVSPEEVEKVKEGDCSPSKKAKEGEGGIWRAPHFFNLAFQELPISSIQQFLGAPHFFLRTVHLFTPNTLGGHIPRIACRRVEKSLSS